MRTILIRFENKKYVMDFLRDEKVIWTVTSHTLQEKLPELIYEWIEGGIRPAYTH